MILFRKLLNRMNELESGGAVFDAVASALKVRRARRRWTYDPERELRAAREIARNKPDVLLPVVSAVQEHFMAVRGLPDDFNVIVSGLRRTVADALADLFAARQVRASPIRVVLMAPWLAGNVNNNILRVIAGYLSGLEQMPEVESVSLLVTNENALPRDDAAPGRRLDAAQNRPTHEKVFREAGLRRMEAFYAPPPFADGGNAAWIGKFFAERKPNLVFVPNFEMTSYYVHGLGKVAATVYLQTSINNRPPYDFNRYLYLGEPREIDSSHLHSDRWHYHRFGYIPFGSAGGLGRADLGIAEDDIVLVTAGNRLETEVTREFGEVVCTVMRANRRIRWLLLGVREEARVRENLAESLDGLADRLVIRGYVAEIGRYLELADLYVNPRRTGGAVSMALAAYGRTPVLGFPGSDAANFLLPEMIRRSPEDFGQTLGRLVSDPTGLASIGVRQHEHFVANHSPEASARDLIDHFRAALEARTAP